MSAQSVRTWDNNPPSVRPPMALRIARSIGAAAGATFTIVGFLAAEAVWVRRRIGPAISAVPPLDSGTFGAEYPGRPIRLAILGDSNAAGVGAIHPEETVGSHLATSLSDVFRLPVDLRNVASSGALSDDLADQINSAVGRSRWPDVCLIVIGGNDVMRMRSIPHAARLLGQAVRRLRRHGTAVVVATCPDMGAERPLLQPLRLIAGRYGRVLASAQRLVARREGARTVSLADALGPLYRRFSGEMFAADHFHSSAVGYKRAAEVLLPSVRLAARRFVQ